jgi:hypothetical protein
LVLKKQGFVKQNLCLVHSGLLTKKIQKLNQRRSRKYGKQKTNNYCSALFIVLIGVLLYQFVLKPQSPTPSATPSTQQTSTTTKTRTQSTTPTTTGDTSIAPSIETLEQNVDEIIENLLSAIQIVQFDYQKIVPHEIQ